VFAQSYTDFYVYAVDDGSTDGTYQVLKSNSHRCSFVSQPHAGPAATRNRAIRMSDSPFVAFLDADDEWVPKKLERQISLLKRDPSLGMVSSFCWISGPGMERWAISLAYGVPSSGRLFRRLLRNRFVFTSTVVVRRHCLEEVGLFNESLAVNEDFNLWLRIAAHWRTAFMTDVLAAVHEPRQSVSASISPEEWLKSEVVALEHVRSSCPELPLGAALALQNALAVRTCSYGSFLLSIGAKASARRELLNALLLQPVLWGALARLGLSFLPTGVANSFEARTARLPRQTSSGNLSPLASRDASSI